ncbi:N-6 DNA methylase [Nonomuraea rosea]|uniref:N-6 DNA methylase n=1 Tax=Nonomuraea rosea TaxID=638574 RepID=A0ABP6VL95_9ACTN
MRPEQGIAEAVSAVWYSHHGGSRMEVPVGVVASVMVTHPDALITLPTMAPEEFAALLRKVWGYWWLDHPHLAEMARPITSWLDEDPDEHTLKAAKAVAEAAMRRRIKSVQGLETDILSYVVTDLRSHGARKGLGEYHTPPDVCATMATMMIPEVPPKGEEFGEPCAGTGGMVRAYAHRIKQLGGDPADYVWHMADVDPISAAASAVNALVWNLGGNVLVFQGDTIRHGDHDRQATKHKAGAVQRWTEVVKQAAGAYRLIKTTKEFEALMEG